MGKSATAIFFLLFFSVSQGGHYVLYFLQKWHIREMVKQEVYAGVAERFLEVVEQNGNINWVEEGKEFSLNGQMYDVVKVKKDNGRTLLYCLKDKDEDRVLATFGKAVKPGGHGEEKNNKHFFKFQLTDTCITDYDPPGLYGHTAALSYFSYEPSPVTGCIEIVIPPPRHQS